MENKDPQFIGSRLLDRGFRVWFLYLFRYINGSPFIEQPLHKELFKQIERMLRREDNRLCINLAPRSGKTTLNMWMVVYILTVNPKAHIIYTSFNQDLLRQIAEQVAAIMSNPIYQAMYGRGFTAENEEVDPIDDFWKDYLFRTTGKLKFSSRKITTPNGGVVLFSSIGSAITGFGCFDYDTLVATRKGKMKLGDIVENRLDVEVLSYNQKTNKKEYKKIYRYIKNDQSKYMRLVLDNGEIINTTPDHIFYTDRGELRADHLLMGSKIMADFFDFPNWYIKFCGYVTAGVVSVKNKINLLFCKRFFDIIKRCLAAVLNPMTVCDFTPNNAALNVRHRRRGYAIVLGNLFIWSCVFGYVYGLCCSKFLEFSIAEKLIVGIILGCSITQVLKSVICLYRIYMSGLEVGLSNKCKKQKPMNKKPFMLAYRNAFISFMRKSLFNKPIAFLRKYFSLFRNKITVQFRYRKVIDIIYCNHLCPSYCLTLWDNNNLFVGKSKLLVHNCGLRHPIDNLPDGGLFIDDADKPTDVRSEKIRQKTHTYFQETLLSRLNNSNTVISNTQQRLHLDDMTGFLIENYGFKVFKFPLIADDGTCNLGNQYTPERIKELQVDQYTFSAQYQQEPIILGGGVIKHEWWRFYKNTNDCMYRRIYITADTAMKTKEWNDFTAIGVWGLTNTNKLRMLDLVHGKFEIPELEATMIALWEKWKQGIGTCRCSSIIIEDKASGTQLIQSLMRKGGLPIQRVIPEKDKYTRVMNAVPQLAAGNIELPENDKHPLSKLLIDEADAFTADDSHCHDDLVDMWCYAVDSAFNSRGIF